MTIATKSFDRGSAPVAPVADGPALAAYLASHDATTPFHDPRWCRAVEQACGHGFLLLGATCAEGKLVGYLPLTHVRSKLFGEALVSSAFAVGGGILADDAPTASALADAAWALAGRLGVGSVELRGGIDPAADRDREAATTPWQRDDATYAHFAWDLAEDDQAQLLAITKRHRAEVRKSLDGNLTVRIGRDAIDRRQHYAVYAESVRNLGTPVFPRALFDAMLDAFGDHADILTVLDNGVPVASVLSLYHRGTVMPYWGGGTQAARRLRANERAYYELMLHARRRGCTRFDFGRSKVGTGPYAYKKNWGFEPTPMTYYARSAEGQAQRSVNPLDAKYRLKIALWKKLPLPIANRIGPLIARGLG